MAMLAPRRSLRARALQLLAQREQSRSELRRKLFAHALAEERATGQSSGHSGGAQAVDAALRAAPLAGSHESHDGEDRAELAARAETRVDAELDWLEAHEYLSPERFVESRVHARASRFGNLRIRQELAQHALDLPAATAQALKESELERACAVLSRKFRDAPQDAAGRARQARFLAGRGFSSEVIRRAVRAAASVDGEASAGRFGADDAEGDDGARTPRKRGAEQD